MPGEESHESHENVEDFVCHIQIPFPALVYDGYFCIFIFMEIMGLFVTH